MKEKVDLNERSYEILIERGAVRSALQKRSEILSSGKSLTWIADSKVLELYKDSLKEVLENSDAKNLKGSEKIFPINGGESSKSFKVLEDICESFAESYMDRGSCVFALGGGVVGDIAGFAAACYMRGVDFYQIPTTLLAMVDSSVGGKTGLNIAAGKNLVGAFHQPKGVFMDVDFLQTLPPREFAAGMSEVIKYALIGDSCFFEKLSAQKFSAQSEELLEIVAKCCRMKAQIVKADELETSSGDGGRALLNFGHTFGHAIEKCAGYGKYLHGEAVAVGMCMAGSLSEKLGLISSQDLEKIKETLSLYGLPISFGGEISMSDFKNAMMRDKKAIGKSPRFVLLNSIGKSFVKGDISSAQLDSVLEEYCS